MGALLIAVMAWSFGYEYVVAAPDQAQVVEGLLLPICPGCGHKELLQAVGVIGAIIMPHNLYLHSALVKSRDIDRTKKSEVKEANMYFFIEAAIALFGSFLINIFVVSVFAEGLYDKTNAEIHSLCIAANNSHADQFYQMKSASADTAASLRDWVTAAFQTMNEIDLNAIGGSSDALVEEPRAN